MKIRVAFLYVFPAYRRQGLYISTPKEILSSISILSVKAQHLQLFHKFCGL